MDGNHQHVDVLACGCVACGSAMCVDENKCKGKKNTYLVGCERVDVLVCRHGLDVDDCEDKEREKKRKERKTYWTQALHTDGSGCRCHGMRMSTECGWWHS